MILSLSHILNCIKMCLHKVSLCEHDMYQCEFHGYKGESVVQWYWDQSGACGGVLRQGLIQPILFIYSVYWYWSHSDSRLIFLPASGPIVLVDSCTARCCDSELRLTVHCCALWPIVAVTLLFLWRLLFALPYCSLTVYKSGLLGTL